jgi:BRCT domain type II-containing protein
VSVPGGARDHGQDRQVVVTRDRSRAAEQESRGDLPALQAESRSEAERKVREFGGSATGSVSAKTDFVVVGKEPGSKADKAQKLGIKILTEKQFLKLLPVNKN